MSSNNSTLVDHPLCQDEDENQVQNQFSAEIADEEHVQPGKSDEEEQILDLATQRQLPINSKARHTKHRNKIANAIQSCVRKSVLRFMRNQLADLHSDC